MSPQHPLRNSEDEANLHAWQSDIARSAPTPGLAEALEARGTDLPPRLATCHTLLRTLPRRTRRAWQRQLARSSELTAVLATADFNLFGSKGSAGVTGVAPGPSDIVPSVALAKILGPLADNGGPTKTHALKPGSPAVNAVPSSDPACTGADQRGIARPQPPGSNCDIGAFELE